MKKTIVTAMTLLFMVGSVSAGDLFGGFFDKDRLKGSGDIVTVERDIEDFSRIRSTGSYDIVVTIGKEKSITITFDDNLVDNVITEVRGRTLEIDSDLSYSSRKNCLIEITVPELTEVKLSGSGDVEVFNLDCEDFEFRLSGSGDMRAEGKVEDLEVTISGSGDINTSDLIAQTVYAKISGSGDITVFADDILEARVSGSGDIRYFGGAKDVSKSITGSGSIRRKR